MKTRAIKVLTIFLALILIEFSCKKKESSDPDFWDFDIKLEISPQTGSVGTEFTFNATGSKYNTGNNSYVPCEFFSWDFDYTGPEDIFWDVEKSTNPVQYHTYDSPGTYEMVLLAHGAEESETRTKTIVVSEDTNNPPMAFFTITPDEGYPYIFLFTFIADGCTDQEDPIDALEVRWDWENDGTYDTEFSPTKYYNHIYNYTGEIEVKMQVKDSGGLLGELIRTVTVLGPGGAPCPGTESVDYGSKSYTTVQIGNQCWLNENLNIGEMILTTENPSQNTPLEIIEKYCYDNDTEMCEDYGGLYSWNEMMQYVENEGAKGICPEGWHIPTDEDWKKLEGAIDSQFGYPDPEWDKESEYRGFDIGWNIRSQTVWAIGSGGYDKFGFGALGGGRRYYGGSAEHLGMRGYFWTSSKKDETHIWCRWTSGNALMARVADNRNMGYSVRCLKND
ncbi:MAG: hypothetical protein K9G76_02695 [Bacteroidales bacterium]|nr:hypothetical protein [Bacteroidales bacterium]MCF8404209.1 hypothetical protein [Bacteroidales bacterium]